jgi:hypothetical protein
LARILLVSTERAGSDMAMVLFRITVRLWRYGAEHRG